MSAYGEKQYTKIFYETYGAPPWGCYFCEGPISTLGRGRGKGHVHHRDGDHRNNAPENLAAVHHGCHSSYHLSRRPTNPAQSREFYEHWRSGRVELPWAILSPEKVQAIRVMAHLGASIREIATMFGMRYGTIYLVVRGDRWRHVPAVT